MIGSEACNSMQAMTDAADKVADKAVPMTEKAAEMIEEKAAQVCTSTLLEESPPEIALWQIARQCR